jgi:hypothetical protein
MTNIACKVIFGELAVMLLAGCVTKMPYSYVTDYAGNGIGRIEKRVDVPSASAVTVPVRVGVTVFEIPGPVRYPGRIQYQIRSSDGTLHVLSSDIPFEIGSCVAFAGFADGPSRTHWSFGRVTSIELSKNCD